MLPFDRLLLAETSGAVAAEAPAEAPAEMTTWNQMLEWTDRIWNFQLMTIDNAAVTPGKLLIALAVFLIGQFLARVISRHVGQRVLPRFRVERGPAYAIQSLLFYILLIMVLMFALQMAEVPLAVFTIFGGALALGIGFGSQNVVNNFISGLILMLERPIRVGDLVEIEGTKGVVERIGARATHLTAYDQSTFVVPNSVILENCVSNWNVANDLVRTVVAVGVAYGSPTDTVRELINGCMSDNPEILDDPPSFVYFTDFGDNALAFEAHFWITPKTVAERHRIESDLRFAIDAAFRKADITISFPQRDVHLDTLRPLEVKMVERSPGV